MPEQFNNDYYENVERIEIEKEVYQANEKYEQDSE